MDTLTVKQSPTFAGKTADEWRAEAADCRRREQESWERSDTDGFLSQWALTQMALRYDHCATVAENNGMIVVEAPINLETGDVIKGDWVQGQYGESFFAWEPVNGQQYLHPSRAKNPERARANDKAKGLEMHRWSVAADLNSRTGRPEPGNGHWVDLGLAYGSQEVPR